MPEEKKKTPPAPSKRTPLNRRETILEYRITPPSSGRIEKRSKIMPLQELPPAPPRPKR